MRILSILLVTLLLGAAPLWATPVQEQQPPPPAPEEEPEEPVKPPRIIGQPQTQEEFDLWMAIQQAFSVGQKVELSQKFLDEFPESGLLPFVHDLLAQAAFQDNEYQKFVFHAEESLADLPENPILLVRLAYMYAERGDIDNALGRGQQGLEVLSNFERPPQLSGGEWAMQKDQLESEVSYSLGLAHLKKSLQSGTQDKAEDPSIQEALRYLQRATELDPGFDAAYFRLGFIHTVRNEAESAVRNHARASALDGIASAPAREQLERVLDFIKENMPDSELSDVGVDELIDEQKAYLQEKIAERQARYEAMKAAEEQPPSATPPPQ